MSKRHTMMTNPLAPCGLLLALAAPALAQPEVALDAAQQKITTASAVRARGGPQVSAQEITRLRLGAVVSATARTAAQEEVGGKQAYWYKVNLPAPTGGQGWVFGGLLADYDAARRSEIARRIIDERLKAESMSFDDGVDLYDFVSRALAEAEGPDERAWLELSRLRALERATSTLPYEARERPQYRDWFKAHEKSLLYHELAGAWQINSEAVWELERKYRGTPAGERVAWEAAQNSLPGECESDEVCQFFRLQQTEGRYLGLYPNGAHAREALRNFDRALASADLKSALRGKGGDKYAVQTRAELRKALAELRPAVLKSSAPEKVSVLKKLDALAPARRHPPARGDD